MKKLNIVQFVSALVGLAAVLLLPYFVFSFLGVVLYPITPITVVQGMYPIFLVPLFCMILLVILSFSELKSISIPAGVVVLLVHIVFAVMRQNIILNGDLTLLIQQAKGLVEKAAGATTNIEIRQILAPLLKVGIGFYISLLSCVVYIVGGLLFSGARSSVSGRSGSTSDGVKPTGRRTF